MENSWKDQLDQELIKQLGRKKEKNLPRNTSRHYQ